MRRKIAKYTIFSVTGLVVLTLCIFAAAAWRLSQGPVSLSYFNSQLREIISNGLGGSRTEISDLVIERNAQTGHINLRMRDLRIFDDNSALIAKAPRAAIGIDIAKLLSGSIVPNRLELIGPNIKIRRLITGEIKMGFGEADQTAVPPSLPTNDVENDAISEPADLAQEQEDVVELRAPESGLANYVRREFFSKADNGSNRSTITAISISNASISLYEQENDVFWRIPNANLAFKKVDFGASLFFDAKVASGTSPWTLDVVANYRRSTDNYAVVARVNDLVPAELSKKLFMLSQLTKVRIPLSGQINLELDGQLKVNSADGHLTAAAGQVEFPDFLSWPINVENGILNLAWDPQSEVVILQNSTLTTRTALSAINAHFRPVWSDDGHLNQIDFALKARNSAKAGSSTTTLHLVDRIDASGSAKVEEGQVQLDDLLVTSGASGVRLRGYFTEGNEAISMKVSGRILNMPFSMATELWPPIVAPLARVWMRENIRAGKIDDGTFTVNLPSEVLGPAITEKRPIPDNLIDAQMDFSNVNLSYFEGQPDVNDLKGKIIIRGDSLDLSSLQGTIKSSNGGKLNITDGRMMVTEFANPVSRGDLQVNVKSDVSALLELADRPPLRMISSADFNAANASGTADMKLALKMPLISGLKREDIKISAKIKLKSFGLKGAFRELDLSNGDLDVDIDSQGLRANGNVKLDNIPAKLSWSRKTSPVNIQAFKLETVLDAKLRRKFGLDLSRFLSGPIGVKLEGSGEGSQVTRARITADLAKTKLQLTPIHWNYGPRKGTRATFDIDFSDAQKVQIRNLSLTGDDLVVKGDISLKSSGDLLIAKLPSVRLGRLNVFSLTADRHGDGSLALDVNGQSFDARPMITGLFAESTGQTAPSGDSRTEIKANIGKIYAFRERHVSNVRAVASSQGDALVSMKLEGRFSDGAPMQLEIQPRTDGSRDMVLKTANGGAALRASNLYSKVQGGQLDFKANLGRPGEGTIRRGDLTIRNFVVSDEEQLAQFEPKKQGKNARSHQRSGATHFDKLTLPFAVDKDFVRIGDASVQGPSVGALAHGSIRKVDGRLSIGGTLIPAYGLNSAFSNVPIIGTIITGGKDEGLIGLTFGLSGTMSSPEVQINPVSAIAPGILRKVFEFQGQGALDEEAKRAKRKRNDDFKSDNR